MYSRQVLCASVFLASWMTIEAVIKASDVSYESKTADTYDWTKHPCRRSCDDSEVLECRYVFVVEKYSTMSKACYDCPFNATDCERPHCIAADGEQKNLYVINRQLPGPSIEVCHGDTIVVDVVNAMLSDSCTVHWHGIDQKGTPHMDGVPYVTQCPILPGQKFRYRFNATDTGSYFWHSHSGVQRADGFFGALIIHPRRKTYDYKKLYDHDRHHMIITDWMQRDADAAFIKEYNDRVGINPTTILVNGKGRYNQIRKANRKPTYTPLEVFNVDPNKRYRFRLINAGAEDCPIEMSIDSHPMKVISLDSRDIEAVRADVITTWPGERVDFTIKTIQSVSNYWIRYRGLGLCQNSTTQGAWQVAILRYTGAPIENPSGPVGYNIPEYNNETRVLNPYEKGTEAPQRTNINIPLLTSTLPNDPAVTERVDQREYISFDLYPLNNFESQRANLYGYYQVPEDRRIGTFQLNHMSLELPAFPLLTQRDQLNARSFCNSSNIPSSCMKEQCSCTHVIQVKLGNVVEFVLVDEGRYFIVNHPFHLHGHFFRVIATENLKGVVTIERIKKLDREGKIKRRLDHAPLKDTFKTPGGGYSIIRFHADNPGYWIFHCHFEQHSNVGMALVVKVGEHKDMPPVPRNFPKCGNYDIY